MPSHPNATAAALGGAVATILVFILEELGVANGDIPAEIGAAIATLIAAVVLFVGRPRSV